MDSSLRKPITSPDGADGREACPDGWYVARVQMNSERKVASRLEALGIRAYVPTVTEVRQWSDRKKRVERVLIPAMVFFKADGQEAQAVTRLSYVNALLRAPGESKAALVPDSQIERLKLMIGQSDGKVMFEAGMFSESDPVKVTRGVFAGLSGRVTRVDEKSWKISIVIDYLGCASIVLDASELEIDN